MPVQTDVLITKYYDYRILYFFINPLTSYQLYKETKFMFETRKTKSHLDLFT